MKGYITIYFSLLLLVIFSVLCTTIESARLGGVRLRCQSSAYLALESVFADYSLPVAKEYGLLMLDKSYGTDNPEQYKEYLLDYMSYNAIPNKGLLVRGADFYQVQPEEISLREEQIISEEGAKALEEEILAYMKYAAPAEIVEWALEKLGVLEQADVVTGIIDRLSSVRAEATEVDLAIQKIHRGLNQIKGYSLDVRSAADRIKQSIEEVEELYEDYDELLEEETADEAEEEKRQHRLERLKDKIENMEDRIAKEVGKLKQEHTTLLDYNREVAENKEKYDSNTQLVAEKLADMENSFAEEKKKLDTDMRNAVDTEIWNIRTYSAGEGDFYKVEEGTQDIAANIAVLQGNISALEPYTSGGVSGLKSVLDSCVEAMDGYRTDRMQLNYTDEAAKGNGVDVMELVANLLGNGLLGLVAENPSALSNLTFSTEEPYEDSLRGYRYSEQALTEQILINEYLFIRFGNLLEPKEDRPLAYETEYVLAGRESDRQNLEAVAAELMLLRSGMNLIHLLGSEEKQMAAEALAILLVGFTGMKGAIDVTKLLILVVWAQAEGIADVRALFAGKRIPMLKDDTTWQLSFTKLLNLNASNLPYQMEEQKGLTYKDYLRLLLIKEDRGVRNGRIMDLIEGFVRTRYDTGFSMKECVTELVVHTSFKAKPVFMKLPFITQSGKAGDYQIEGISSYGY